MHTDELLLQRRNPYLQHACLRDGKLSDANLRGALLMSADLYQDCGLLLEKGIGVGLPTPAVAITVHPISLTIPMMGTSEVAGPQV